MKCPKCKKDVDMKYPAISRRDNKTKICSECGVREAFKDYGLNKKQSEAIIKSLNEWCEIEKTKDKFIDKSNLSIN